LATTGQRLSNYLGERKIATGDLAGLAAKYWFVALIAGVVIFGAVLRLWDLGERAVHHDESIHIKFAWDITQGVKYTHDPVYHGPFNYFGTAAIFKVFGDSDYTSRLLPALFGIGLIALPFMLRRQLGTIGALAAGFMLAVSPSILYFSRFARNDIYILFFALAIVVCIWRFMEDIELDDPANEREGARPDAFLRTLTVAGGITLLLSAAFGLGSLGVFGDPMPTQYWLMVPFAGLGAFAFGAFFAEKWNTRDFWLVAIAPLLALSFTAKEVTFIVAGILLVFVNLLLATQLVQQYSKSREMTSLQTVVAYAVTIPSAWAIAAVWSVTEGVRKRFSLNELPSTLPIMIILGTLCAPQFAAAIQQLPFIEDNGYMAEGDLMRWTTLLLILGGAYIGLIWNWRIWLAAGIIFYGVFVLLYTSFFTNMPGFWTGIWGSMDYWLGQQHVRRGDQPDYYYFMLLPVYEFLPLVFAIAGTLYYSFKGKVEQVLLAGATLLLVTTLSLMPDDALGPIGEFRIQLAFIIALAAVIFLSMDWFTKFLLFWTIAIFFGLTVAGEKMPWLVTHLALPISLLAAKVLHDILSSAKLTTEEAAEGEEHLSLDSRAIGLFAGVALVAVAATLIFLMAGPSSGASVLAWLLALVALGGVVWAARNVSWQTAGQLVAVGLFAAMSVLTIRAGSIAAFDEGEPNGVPPEMLIYAQGSAGLGEVNDRITQAAEASGLGKDVKIVIDNSGNIWPWPWYMRDYKDVVYTNFEEEFVPQAGAVVLVSTENQAKMEPYLDRYLEGIPYTHMWWFPELYKGLERDDFIKAVFNGDLVDTYRLYFIDREVIGATSTPNMIAYFPKEFAGFVEPPETGFRADAPEIPAADVTVLASLGTEVGQVSQPAGIDVDEDGNVYVVDTLNQRIQIIAPDGTVSAFGESGTGDGQFANPAEEVADYDVADGPWGIAVGEDGAIYVADTWNHRVQKFTSDGEYDPSFNVGGLFGPRDLTVLPDGNLLVVDTGNKQLGLYDPSGNLQRVIGGPGSERGQFNEPSSVDINSSGDVYVADFWNKRIQRFDSQFQFSAEYEVDSWGSQGITDRAYVAALDDGTVLATDPANGAIVIFNPAGEEIAAWSLPNVQSRPVGIAVDAAEENVYITDGLASQVVRVPLAALLGAPDAESGAATP